MTPDDREHRLGSLYASHADRVLTYASRHTDAATAQDVVQEVFLVAWRRLDHVPDEAFPWLLVVARNTLANGARSRNRRQRATGELANLERVVATSPDAADTAVERAAVTAALAGLAGHEREALLLVAWDGLTAAGAAAVMGCSRHTFEVRLSRARARLTRALADQEPPAESSAAPARRPHLQPCLTPTAQET